MSGRHSNLPLRAKAFGSVWVSPARTHAASEPSRAKIREAARPVHIASAASRPNTSPRSHKSFYFYTVIVLLPGNHCQFHDSGVPCAVFIYFDKLGIKRPVMPASIFDMDRPVSGALEDQRALHLAFELSRLNLASDHHNINSVSDSLDQVIIPTAFPEETRSKKSQNMTECVPVPSSEHVAEIVGRQGKFAKIVEMLPSGCVSWTQVLPASVVKMKCNLLGTVNSDSE